MWKLDIDFLDFFQTFDNRSSCVFNRYFLQNWSNSYELNFLLILQVTNTWKRAFMHCKQSTCKVRNEIETKRNETERNETKSIETKRNRSKRNETKSNETKRNETTLHFVSFRFDRFRFVSFGFVSFCLISFRFVRFRLVSISFHTLQVPNKWSLDLDNKIMITWTVNENIWYDSIIIGGPGGSMT